MADYACAVVVRDGRLLLGLRSPRRRRAAGRWDVIGGKVEPGETVAAALSRELLEEIGVTPIRIGMLGVIEAAGASAPSPDRYHIHAVSEWAGPEPAMRGHEHVALRWFTLADACAEPLLALPDYPPYFARALAG